ncbi:hypothetical protein GHO41_05945 [Pseudomonas sp. FSL R10-0399]|uniref:hypothetical protein n=1 Tax=Pseudomonas sp. FSL R10-0399 TaxID=2662194 RepID=UPI001295E148|nr:hypothetical protein [Pseudomonas sp. FSL R10-0399]MQT56891.1 hypothetical protein [Pseudomonas sp. FSL R10-0399]
MNNVESKLTEVIEDIETLGNKFVFLITAATAEDPLSARARIGLLEFGSESIKALSSIENKLKNYRAGTPS